ncbi:hypothetical protein NMD10_11165 [Citrobacter portucalensis]
MTTNNHPAHGPVSLDRLHQIREHLQHDTQYSNGGNRAYILADMLKVIDGAIAAFGAEPVAVNDDMAYSFHHALSDSSLGADEVEEIKTGLRAAFANVTAQPATEVPDTLPCPVHLEPGLKFGKGVPTRLVLGALCRRADYYAELEAMTPEQRAEHDAGISEFKAMLGGGFRDLSQPVDPQIAEYEKVMLQAGNSPSKCSLRDGIEAIRNSGIPVDVDKIQSERVAGNHTEQHLDMVDHSGDDNEKADCKLPFDQWLSQQNEPIDVDCGCVTTEAFYHWLRVAYEAYNSPVAPDGYVLVPKEISCAMDDAAWEAYHETRCMSDIWAALLAAAPQKK